MTRLARIAFICEGDAEADAFSGTAKNMVEHLRGLGHEVVSINVKVGHPWRAMNALRSFSPDRSRWQARFRYGAASFASRSALAERKFASLPERPDVILQIGATFAPPTAGRVPYAVYCDWNMALSIRNRRAHGLSASEADAINKRQRSVYQGASIIFTICERLRESFLQDYAISPSRVVRAYPGANIDLESVPRKHTESHLPTILFIGKEFHRKGGDILLRAFELVRKEFPAARLLIVGVPAPKDRRPGVEYLGVLRKAVPEEKSQLIQAFLEADLFCLPSRHDPFPNVVREAMLYQLPCVTSNVWAFNEMVVHGETGFTCPIENPTALASCLAQLISDPILAQRFGDAGRRRAEENFSWTLCATIMSDHIQSIVAKRQSESAVEQNVFEAHRPARQRF